MSFITDDSIATVSDCTGCGPSVETLLTWILGFFLLVALLSFLFQFFVK
jgi:hypothetical protein